MEQLTLILQSPFTWGLILGLLVAAFVWKSSLTRRGTDRRENRRLETELRELQGHLANQLKINATGNQAIQTELETLKVQNENLRHQISIVSQKPGRNEMRQSQVQENAIRLMREQAPGFAPAWEKAMRQAESEMQEADSGLRKWVRRVLPNSLGAISPPSDLAE